MYLINDDVACGQTYRQVLLNPWVATQKRVTILFDWVADKCSCVEIIFIVIQECSASQTLGRDPRIEPKVLLNKNTMILGAKIEKSESFK